MTNIISDMLNYLEVKHTTYYANKQFNENPHNNDMYGLSKILQNFNVYSVGLKNQDLSNLAYPFICLLWEKFVIVTESVNNNVTYLEGGKYKTVNVEEFKKSWDGNALIISDVENAYEKNYKQHVFLHILNIISISSLFFIPVLLSFICGNHNLYSFPIYMLSTIGLVISIMLLKKGYHEKSKIGDTLCSLVNNNGCDAVVTSKGAMFMYIYSWSEIGIAYFFMSYFIIAFAPNMLYEFVLLNYIAMTYSIWSIWYQSNVVNKWCVLCLSVQAIIWILGIYYSILLQSDVIHSSLSLMNVCILALISFYILQLVHFVSKFYGEKNKISSVKQKLKKFQVNNEIFTLLSNREKEYIDASNYSTIFFGNPNGKYQITILTNPNCRHCAELHKKMEDMLYGKHSHLGFRFVFTFYDENAAKLLIAASKKYDEDAALSIFGKWFNAPNRHDENFIKSFGINFNDIEIDEELNNHRKWIKLSKLTGTPFIIVNGHKLPNSYDVLDLLNMED